MKYAIFDNEGCFVHIVIFGIHAIPESSFKVTNEQERALLNESDGIWKLIDGKIVKAPLPAPAEPEPPTLADIQAQRLAAYRTESDPLKIEAEYDALTSGTEPDYSAWVAKVEEIKARNPLPATDDEQL